MSRTDLPVELAEEIRSRDLILVGQGLTQLAWRHGC